MDGDNVMILVDVVVDGDCSVPIPTRKGVTMLYQEISSQLLWPRHLVIPQDEKQQRKNEFIQADERAPSPIQTR
ncbi:hypothetical protein Csa_018342 [Cucumis sativus]|uniref:Transposase Tnp1/En/Spm-like domain-containing protein n=1 Tax=Cucumis sativus TaxID=3659 RepID=A0A0A0KMP7_CUCSA|nr:hypothetical protein Csa_018342 [Cucumis sativus]